MEELKISKNLRKNVKYRLRYFTNPTIDNIIDVITDEYNKTEKESKYTTADLHIRDHLGIGDLR